jgi:hypothetical protein
MLEDIPRPRVGWAGTLIECNAVKGRITETVSVEQWKVKRDPVTRQNS